MTLRNKLTLRIALAVTLSFLPAFLTMDYAAAQTRPEQIAELAQARDSYNQRFGNAFKRIAYL